MGRGDKKTKKGKITIGSFGKIRKARPDVKEVASKKEVEKADATPKKKVVKKAKAKEE